MKDFLANQFESYRTRLACLDRPAHRALWENRPPAKFAEKVAEARALTEALAKTIGQQGATITGHAADKRRKRRALETEAHKVGGLVVVFARDRRSETLAAKYDLTPNAWRKLRDEALHQRALLLREDAASLAAGPDAAEAAGYGITPETITGLAGASEAFEAVMAAPLAARSRRHALTKALPEKSREVRRKFREIEALIRFHSGTPEGDAFIAAYRLSGQVVDRGG